MSDMSDKTPLDEIADGKLPERIVKAIDEMEVSVSEMAEWEDSKSPFYLRLDKGGLRLKVKVHISLLKLILIAAGLAGAGGLLWGVVKLLFG